LIPVIALTLGAVFVHSDSARPQITLRSGGNVVANPSFDLADKILASRTVLNELVKGNKTCLEQFDLLAHELEKAYNQEGSLTSVDVEKILASVDFAAEKHKLQVRKNQEQTPYISHPIGVAVNVMKIGQVRDADVVVAAVLHDTIEDTQTTHAEIESLFGKQVAQYVNEVTDDKNLTAEQRKRQQVVNAAHKSAGAAQIKLADKLYNLTDLSTNPPADWNRERIDRYYQWTKSVVDRLPSANERLKDAVEEMIHTYWDSESAQK
jgi:guanosine-3',5'-bis(diphosphate) 3'-pyrophosphohydrolase